MTLATMHNSHKIKLKSFERYHADRQTEKLVQKAYLDHLLQQLAVATQSQPNNGSKVLEGLNEIKEMMSPVNKFFDKIQIPVKKNISNTPVIKTQQEIEDEEDEKQMALIKAKALERLAKKNR